MDDDEGTGVILTTEHDQFAEHIDKVHQALVDLNQLWARLDSRDHYGALGEEFPEGWDDLDTAIAKVAAWSEHQKSLG